MSPSEPVRHVRHQRPTPLTQARALIVAVPEMQSHVNLARIVRAAGCCGIRRIMAAGRGRIDPAIARAARDAGRDPAPELVAAPSLDDDALDQAG